MLNGVRSVRKHARSGGTKGWIPRTRIRMRIGMTERFDARMCGTVTIRTSTTGGRAAVSCMERAGTGRTLLTRARRARKT
eukprot:26374_6